MKIVTFSYDDSMLDDIELVKLFNKYNIKGTFNINTGICDSSRIKKEIQKKIYSNHEVCVHTLTHPRLEQLSDNEIIKEVKLDKENIEKMFGEKCVGMAYPYGTYDDNVISIIKKLGIKHCRTVYTTGTFEIPNNALELKQTAHHNDDKLFDLACSFLELDGSSDDYLFSIWGHSFEFTQENTVCNFKKFEEFLKIISNKEDILYLGITEALTKLNIID